MIQLCGCSLLYHQMLDLMMGLSWYQIVVLIYYKKWVFYAIRLWPLYVINYCFHLYFPLSIKCIKIVSTYQYYSSILVLFHNCWLFLEKILHLFGSFHRLWHYQREETHWMGWKKNYRNTTAIMNLILKKDNVIFLLVYHIKISRYLELSKSYSELNL